MDFDRLLQQSTHSPNADVEIDAAGADLSGSSIPGARISGGLVLVIDPTAGFIAGNQPELTPGPLRNAPPDGSPGIVRVSGFAEFVYGDTIEEGWLTKDSEVGGDEGKLVSWVPGVDGHTHAPATAPPIKHLVIAFLTGGSTLHPSAGLDPGIFLTTLENDDGSVFPGGNLAASSETVTVTEDAGGAGNYWITYTPTVPGVLYRLRVTTDPGALGGPYDLDQYQFQDISPQFLVPNATSIRFIRGQCWKRGDAGDTGVIFLEKQVF
jgi:hypothetical protein